MPPDQLTRRFYVGDHLVDPPLRRVVSEGESTKLEPKVMQVLLHLASQPGVVVSREELVDAVWEGGYVSPDVVSRAIANLRRVFGDDWREPRVIETLHKSGYRLIAPVRDAPDPALQLGSNFRPSKRIFASICVVGVLLIAAWFTVSRLVQRHPTSEMVLRPFSSRPGPEIQPAFSPDGRRVAFVWAGPTGDNPDVYVKVVGTDTPLQLTTSSDSEVNPVWSPDGRWVAFLRLRGERPGIYRVSAVGGDEQLMLKVDGCAGFDWSADGDSLVLAERGQGEDRFRLVLRSATNGDRRILDLTPLSQGDALGPRYSPDGSRIAFRRIGEEDEVCTVATTGGRPDCLALGAELYAWAPGGDGLLITRTADGGSGLWLASGRGRPRRLLDVGPGAISHLSVGPGEVILSRRTDDTNLWSMARGEGPDGAAEPVRLAATTRWEGSPRIAPDGSRLAFVSDRTGHPELWLLDREAEEPTRLTELAAARLGGLGWAPGSDRIVFEAWDDTGSDLWITAADGGVPTQLTDTPDDETTPSWSRDGKWIYFSSMRNGRSEVWRISTAGGPAQQVTDHGGACPIESPDGRTLLFERGRSVWRRSSEGDEERVLSEILFPCSWEPTGDGINFLDWDEEASAHPSIAHRRFEDGATITLLSPAGQFPERGPVFSTAGDRIVFAQIDRSETDLFTASLIPE